MNRRRSIIFLEASMGSRNYMPTPRRLPVGAFRASAAARCKAMREVLS
jgi:hypothetical protein